MQVSSKADRKNDHRKYNPVRDELNRTGLYHSFRLPDGRILEGANKIATLEARLASFRLPDDLTGKIVLDIGPWDGYFTFELERRGAQLTAIDYVDLDTFRELHRYFGSKAKYHRMDVYELDPNRFGKFDIVLCLGVLYHLKHPLLALEKICAVTGEVCIIDSFAVDTEAWQGGEQSSMPYLEFYETDELAGQLDNWCGPTVSAIEAMARAAGFARTEVLGITGSTARVAAHRHWGPLPPGDKPPLELLALNSHWHRGREFRTAKEEYIALWCKWDAAPPPALSEIFPEVDGMGVAPIGVTLISDSLQITFRVPPGLASGRHEARLKIGGHQWSAVLPFYVDLPSGLQPLRLLSVQDGVNWDVGVSHWSNGGWLTVWVEGLPPEADAGNVIVDIAGVPHLPELVDPAKGQINVHVRPVIAAGTQAVTVHHRGAASNCETVEIKGNRPLIRGLEPIL